MSLLDGDDVGGLNDDTLSELQPTDNFITPPSSDDSSLPPAVVSVETPTAVSSEGKDDYYQVAVDELSKYDVQLKTTEDGLTRLHDLDRVTDTVLAAESIGQSDAEEVNRLLPALSEEVAPPKQFTELPTRTNLTETKAFISQAVASEKDTLVSGFMAIVDAELAVLAPIDIPLLVNRTLEALEGLRQAAILDIAKVGVSKKFYFYRDEPKELIDVRHYPIRGLMESRAEEGTELEIPGAGLACSLTTALTCDDFVKFMKRGSVAYRSPEGALIRMQDRDGDTDRHQWSYMELLSYLVTGEAGTLLSEMALGFETMKTKTEEELERVKKADGTNDSVRVIDDAFPIVRDFTQATIGLFRVCMALKAVTLYSGEVLAIMRKNI